MGQDTDHQQNRGVMSAGGKILLVDGYSILNRAYYGMPDFTNSEGTHTGAVLGFLNILLKILAEEQPTHMAVAFDVHAPTFRHEMYAAYKGTRKQMPDELREQVPLLKDVLDAMGVARVEKAGLEADDIMGTIAKSAQRAGMEAAVLSGDRDLLQVADAHITIVLPRTKGGKTETERFTPEKVKEAYGVTPDQFIELKALQGDTSDNIPGVPKVGEKTARELMETYGSVEHIYASLEGISKKAVRESLRENRALCDLSKDLATIRTDAELDFDMGKAVIARAEGMTVQGADAADHAGRDAGQADYAEILFTPEARTLFQKLEFRQLLARFRDAGGTSSADDTASAGEDVSYNTIHTKEQADELFALLKEEARVGYAFAGGASSADGAAAGGTTASVGKDLRGLAVCADAGEVYYLPAQHAIEEQMTLFDFQDGATRAAANTVSDTAENVASGDATGYMFTPEELHDYMELLSEAKDLALCAFDVKNMYRYFTPAECVKTEENAVVRHVFDVLIAAYLLNPLKSDFTAEDIAETYLGRGRGNDNESAANAKQKDSVTKDVGRKKGATQDEASVVTRTCDLALLAFLAQPVLKEKLEATGQLSLFEEIEMPLTYMLYDMERLGIAAKREALKTYGERLSGRIDELEASIHKAAGEDFNINSPKQLGEILFEKMGLPGGKKTKTGYSTAADVLEKLAEDQPMVRDVLEYRGLAKLKSTYADALAGFIKKDGRIHTIFHQTVTATGRLSSSDPNLQNIPMRTDLGREIRKVFVPEEGSVFVDADYSQIELRILAHMSDDKELIEAYHTDKDIHAITASKVFHVPFDEVTPLMRRNAKAVNFGIVYGISAFGLGNDLSISREEASAYMKQYFETYPGVKRYQQEAVDKAKEHGYSETLYGRRRPVPELKSSNFMQRSFGERVAMNAPIQGTAADIMKIAMIRVWRRLQRDGLQARMILQIHDELLIEAPFAEEEAVMRLLEEEMRGAASLKVPLEVEAHAGSTWFDAK